MVSKDTSRVVHSITLHNKMSLWGYRGDAQSPFIKIVLTDYKAIARTKTLFERGDIRFRDMFNDVAMTFESNIPYTLRFMIDQKVRRLHVHLCNVYTEQTIIDLWYELARSAKGKV